MTTRTAIQSFLNDVRLSIIAKMNRATGETERSLRVSAGDDFGFLVAPAYIEALERGRKPTSKGNTGGPTLRESLLIWIQARGIRPKPGQTEESLSYAIAKSIHKKGSKLYREKRVSGVLSETITEERFAELLDDLAQGSLLDVSSQIIKDFKVNLER